MNLEYDECRQPKAICTGVRKQNGNASCRSRLVFFCLQRDTGRRTVKFRMAPDAPNPAHSQKHGKARTWRGGPPQCPCSRQSPATRAASGAAAGRREGGGQREKEEEAPERASETESRGGGARWSSHAPPSLRRRRSAVPASLLPCADREARRTEEETRARGEGGGRRRRYPTPRSTSASPACPAIADARPPPHPPQLHLPARRRPPRSRPRGHSPPR